MITVPVDSDENREPLKVFSVRRTRAKRICGRMFLVNSVLFLHVFTPH